MTQRRLPSYANIQREGPLPRHFQVRQLLLKLVVSGHWGVGDKLPAETVIAEELGVSKMTVNKAILALTSEGIFLREVGRGTFVAPRMPEPDKTALEARTKLPLLQVITAGAPELIIDDEYHCRLVLAIRSTISPTRTRLEVRQARGSQYSQYWHEGAAQGWVLIAPRRGDIEGLQALAHTRASAVIIGASWPDSPLPFVDSDNESGAALAVNHLAGLGHRRIALLYADPETSNTLARIRGFRMAMHTHALPISPEWLVDVGDDYTLQEAMRQRLRAWLTSGDRPTAIFAAGPHIAREVLDIAVTIGLSVPHDLSIVAFDDPAAVHHANPALTTVLQPLDAMGRIAAEYLFESMTQQVASGIPPKQFLPCTLSERASTAPPAH